MSSYLRNSRGSSSIAPGWVRFILSNRSARGVGGGVESRRARDRSRGVECPELGGDGEASVEDVMDDGMKPLSVLSLLKEEGGIGGLSNATLTRLSISSARSSVFSFSSWISLILENKGAEKQGTFKEQLNPKSTFLRFLH
ncbi:hypothetical protein GOODEAATRI_017804 [Goodea atripinnis]|uniref:Uncharacterized protein n=1 Tax=Goodea atripinnis TaxID=208336 RepID=A0ABV0PZH7_9TELE